MTRIPGSRDTCRLNHVTLHLGSCAQTGFGFSGQ